jgi:hypothetical protein
MRTGGFAPSAHVRARAAGWRQVLGRHHIDVADAWVEVLDRRDRCQFGIIHVGERPNASAIAHDRQPMLTHAATMSPLAADPVPEP